MGVVRLQEVQPVGSQVRQLVVVFPQGTQYPPTAYVPDGQVRVQAIMVVSISVQAGSQMKNCSRVTEMRLLLVVRIVGFMRVVVESWNRRSWSSSMSNMKADIPKNMTLLFCVSVG